ncbi:hypothetical protein ACFVFQ_07590 [Streptomyces sp. NPDC057743]|uniref:hypothetical protein n=1 Tax=Streptomyces sp. NPDC057743 TaxID=3346236 RepID=UPI003694E2DE
MPRAGPGGSATTRRATRCPSPTPAGATAKTRWMPSGQLATVTDPLGRQITHRRDTRGRITETVDPQGGITRSAYDANGRRIAVTTPVGLTSRTEYDPAGRVIATVDPRGWITRSAYNARGELTAQTSPSGVTTRRRYDAAGNVNNRAEACAPRLGSDGVQMPGTDDHEPCSSRPRTAGGSVTTSPGCLRAPVGRVRVTGVEVGPIFLVRPHSWRSPAWRSLSSGTLFPGWG